MKAISYATAQKNLVATMDEVCRDRSPLLEGLPETAYLLRSPTNARRLRGAIRDLGKKKGNTAKIAQARYHY